MAMVLLSLSVGHLYLTPLSLGFARDTRTLEIHGWNPLIRFQPVGQAVECTYAFLASILSGTIVFFMLSVHLSSGSPAERP